MAGVVIMAATPVLSLVAASVITAVGGPGGPELKSYDMLVAWAESCICCGAALALWWPVAAIRAALNPPDQPGAASINAQADSGLKPPCEDDGQTSAYLTVVYTIRNRELFKGEEQRLRLLWMDESGPYGITAMSRDHEIWRLELIERAIAEHQDDQSEALDEIERILGFTGFADAANAIARRNEE